MIKLSYTHITVWYHTESLKLRQQSNCVKMTTLF